MTDLHEKLPAVRPLDITPFRADNHELYFAMRDMSHIATEPAAISLPGYFVIVHLDGTNSCAAIQEAFEREFGRSIESSEILGVVEALDKALLLDTENFERAHARAVDDYRTSDTNDNCSRWPTAETLAAEIQALLKTGKPGECTQLRGLIAPHLDYARGNPCYADAYATLAQTPPAERYVILGTNHFGRSMSVVATGKDFVTPLGRVATDRGFLTALEQRLGTSIREHEFDHRAEHSIELQVHILQCCLQAGSFQIVPILCPDPCGPTGLKPLDGNGPDLGDFADALAALLADTDRRTIVIASADLSHVGQRFGEAEATSPEFMRTVEQSDRRLLALLEQRRESDFIASVSATQNATRICSIGCIYATLRALPDAECSILRYHQATDFANETHVTCAAAVLS